LRCRGLPTPTWLSRRMGTKGVPPLPPEASAVSRASGALIGLCSLIDGAASPACSQGGLSEPTPVAKIVDLGEGAAAVGVLVGPTVPAPHLHGPSPQIRRCPRPGARTLRLVSRRVRGGTLPLAAVPAFPPALRCRWLRSRPSGFLPQRSWVGL